MNTWEKKVKVNKQMIPKKRVLAYYKKLWRESPVFRNLLTKKGAFVRATYDGKTIIKRRNIRIKNINDLEEAVKEHAVEFHIPAKRTKWNSYLDIDMPNRLTPRRKNIGRSIVKKLKKKNVDVSMVTDAPNGIHIFSKTSKSKLKNALTELAKEDKRIFVGRSSKNKIVVDPHEPNVAIPGSLSVKGKPYKRWNKI